MYSHSTVEIHSIIHNGCADIGRHKRDISWAMLMLA